MKTCPVCNKTYHDSQSNSFCEDCGVLLIDSVADIKKEEPKKINKSIIVAIILSVLLVIAIAVIVILLMKSPDAQSEITDNDHVSQEYVYEVDDTVVWESQTVAETIKPIETTTASQVYPDPETTTAAAKLNYPLKNDPYAIHGDGYYIVANTPGGQGLNVYNYLPSESYEYEVVSHINEGGVILVTVDYTSLDGGFVNVFAGVSGWADARYLYPYNPYESYGYTYKDVKRGMLCRVKFSTPAHAGLNMRAQTNSESELLCLVTEGTVLDVLEAYSPDNHGYIKVGYSHPQAGEYFEGWVLAEYIEYYGYRESY